MSDHMTSAPPITTVSIIKVATCLKATTRTNTSNSIDLSTRITPSAAKILVTRATVGIIRAAVSATTNITTAAIIRIASIRRIQGVEQAPLRVSITR
eukprot:CAMPEP_0170473488 /NCGR_PEP_ID=MMETSP0123-20130129/15387_1 /TAXON_ID=182087 /ORGANISM="Favella ehrenbergii, Strain Fehren 1" /LENGTH=96 /DNA_ID=CAMNT_0010742545 /DNA_START=659 /DNA_END=946 /DNA_ORIENTATION=-